MGVRLEDELHFSLPEIIYPGQGQGIEAQQRRKVQFIALFCD